MMLKTIAGFLFLLAGIQAFTQGVFQPGYTFTGHFKSYDSVVAYNWHDDVVIPVSNITFPADVELEWKFSNLYQSSLGLNHEPPYVPIWCRQMFNTYKGERNRTDLLALLQLSTTQYKLMLDDFDKSSKYFTMAGYSPVLYMGLESEHFWYSVSMEYYFVSSTSPIKTEAPQPVSLLYPLQYPKVSYIKPPVKQRMIVKGIYKGKYINIPESWKQPLYVNWHPDAEHGTILLQVPVIGIEWY